MDITIERKYKQKYYTIGKLYINGEYYCDTMEDTDRGLDQNDSLQSITKRKVYGMTAIPTGTYSIKMTYSKKFCRRLPQLLDVPGFEGIRIHSGNTSEDTYGCILPGLNKIKGQVIESRNHTNKIIADIIVAEGKNEPVTITITA